MKENDIEDLFKESFDKYEPEVGSKVWKNIKVFLKWGGLAFFINAFIQKIGLTTLIAVVVSLAAVIGGAVLYNSTDDKKTAIVAQQTVIEKDSNNAINTTNIDNSVTEKANTETPENAEKNNTPTRVKTENKNNELLAAINADVTSGAAPLIVDFSNTGSGKSNKWIFTDNSKEVVTKNATHVFDVAGIYKVLLTSTNSDGSLDTDTISIEVSGLSPKAITVSPNGDGINDEFKLNLQKMASIRSKIVDKNGTVVYQSEAAGEWSGKDLKGNDLPAGFYYYSINAEGVNGKKYDQRGTINLKR